MGATIGGAFGLGLKHAFPAIPFDPAALALAGMAGLIAGATGAALTSIVMIFEMTLDYSVVLPMTLTVAVAHGVRRALFAQNIYTLKLVRRGHYMPEALQANAVLVHHVGDLAMARAAVVPAGATCKDATRAELREPQYLVLVEGDRVVGVVRRDTAHLEALDATAPLADIAQREFAVVAADMTLFELIPVLKRSGAELAVVLAPDATGPGIAVAGVVTNAHIAEALAEGMEISGIEMATPESERPLPCRICKGRRRSAARRGRALAWRGSRVSRHRAHDDHGAVHVVDHLRGGGSEEMVEAAVAVRTDDHEVDVLVALCRTHRLPGRALRHTDSIEWLDGDALRTRIEIFLGLRS